MEIADTNSQILYVDTDHILHVDDLDLASNDIGHAQTYVILPNQQHRDVSSSSLEEPAELVSADLNGQTSWIIDDHDDESIVKSEPPTVVEILVDAEDAYGETDANSRSPEPGGKPLMEITDQTVVTVNGQMCVLRTNPETGSLYAYPSSPRKPGRPRKKPRERKIIAKDSEKIFDDNNSDASCLDSVATRKRIDQSERTIPTVPKRKRGQPSKPKPPDSAIMARHLTVKKAENLESWKCASCGHQSFYERQHQDHLRNVHPDLARKCKCCNFVCLEDKDLVQHYTSLHPKNFCTFCGFSSDRPYIVKRHTMRHTQEGCTCQHCGKTFKDVYILRTHIKMIHMPASTLFECSLCMKKFSRRAHLTRHLRIHEGEKNFKCPQCSYCGIEKADVTKHILIHDEPKFTCEICNKLFRQSKNLDLHMKRHNQQRDYKCGLCNFLGYTFTDIRKHIERSHKEKSLLYCEKCESVFKSLSECIEHITAGSCKLSLVAEGEEENSDNDIIRTDDVAKTWAENETPEGDDHVTDIDGDHVTDIDGDHVTDIHGETELYMDDTSSASGGQGRLNDEHWPGVVGGSGGHHGLDNGSAGGAGIHHHCSTLIVDDADGEESPSNAEAGDIVISDPTNSNHGVSSVVG